MKRNGSIQKLNDLTTIENNDDQKDSSFMNLRNNRSTTPVMNKAYMQISDNTQNIEKTNGPLS